MTHDTNPCYPNVSIVTVVYCTNMESEDFAILQTVSILLRSHELGDFEVHSIWSASEVSTPEESVFIGDCDQFPHGAFATLRGW